MVSLARAKYIRIAPTKARMVIDLVRGKGVDEAFDVLRFTKKKASKIIHAVLKSAVTNAQRKDEEIETKRLYISRATVDGGPSLSRFIPRAMGRATPILKRTSHITIELGAKEPLARSNKNSKVKSQNKIIKTKKGK